MQPNWEEGNIALVYIEEHNFKVVHAELWFLCAGSPTSEPEALGVINLLYIKYIWD